LAKEVKMKGNRLYVLMLLVFLLLVFVYQYYSPKEFVWNPTFYKYDKQPFGSYVFDDVMSTSLTDYRVENKTFYQLYREYGGTRDLEREAAAEEETFLANYLYEFDIEQEDSSSNLTVLDSSDLTVLPSYDLTFLDSSDLPTSRHAFLVAEDRIQFTAVDVMALLNLVEQGHTIMLCLQTFPSVLCDSIGYSYQYEKYYTLSSFARMIRDGIARDSLLLGTDSLHPERIYQVYPHLHMVFLKQGVSKNNLKFEQDSIVIVDKPRYDTSEIIARNTQGNPVAVRLDIGKGELFLVATPLMFTNYSMLDGDNASYAFRLLSAMKDLPMTRIEAYNEFVNKASGSPLRYLLIQPPLRWALYFSLITILLCIIFSAKRRQWVIPVINPPHNEMLRFTQLIGNLYYQRKDYKDMLQQKYLYFCDDVKRINGLDLNSNEPDEELCNRLADKMGSDFKAIWPSYRELKYLIRENVPVDEPSMMRLIDRMNEWKSNL